MMNKGFEVIEAHHLFGIPADRIDTLLHPESYVHSMVEYIDGSILAQISDHDMRLPITLALFEGTRNPNPTRFLPLETVGRLTFSRLDPDRYPCLKMAYEALNRGGIHPCVLNAANEAAVRLFLRGAIPFLEIETIVRRQLDQAPVFPHPTLDDLLKADREVQTAVLRPFLK
jgi:1-deoxy-D-xylulose-5-phosphate reductoisomerase